MTSQGEDEAWRIEARYPSMPPQYPSTPTPPDPVDTHPTRGNWMGTASLAVATVVLALTVLMILGVFVHMGVASSVLAVPTFFAGLLALVLGLLGLDAAHRDRATNRGKSIAGLVIVLIFFLFVFLFLNFAMSWS